MQNRGSIVDIFGIKIRFGNQHFKLSPIHIIYFTFHYIIYLTFH